METISVPLVQIGNSRGIRLPKTLIEQLGFGEQVEITIRQNSLVIRPSAPPPRAGWEDQFRVMAEHGDDRLLDAPTGTRWDETEWQW